MGVDRGAAPVVRGDAAETEVSDHARVVEASCPHCGARRPPLGRFCGACGQEYPTPPPETVKATSPTAWLTGRRALLGLVVIIFVARAIAVRLEPSQGGGSTSAPQAPQGPSDAAIKAAMISNLSNLRDTAIKFDGSTPDIAVRDRVLFVTTTLDPSDTATAASLCRSVAAFTNSSDTAAPLGVIGVTIITGGQAIANCRP